MAQHTPGPWSLVAKGHGYYVKAATPQTRRPICGIAYTMDVDEANARLIAAAPDLCEVAEEAEDLLGMFYAICADMRDGGKWEPPSEAYILRIQDAVRYTRAAITKAKGGA